MCEDISVTKLMELYLDTLQKCGLYLLNEENEVVEYNIFEEFDIGVISFLHTDNLLKLKDAGFISEKVFTKSSLLREKVIDLQQSNKWNLNAVRTSTEWRDVLELADEIKEMQ